jgi:hypothetical protein
MLLTCNSISSHAGSAVLVQAGLGPQLSLHCSPDCTSQLVNMLRLVAALIAFWICWPVIDWCIGTVAWLGSWYACITECLPMLK